MIDLSRRVSQAAWPIHPDELSAMGWGGWSYGQWSLNSIYFNGRTNWHWGIERERERRTGGAEGYKTTFRRRRRDICTNTLRIKRARRQTTDEDSVFLINWMVNRRTWYRLWQSLNLDKRRLKDLHLLMVSNWFSHSLQIISIGLLQLIYSLQSHPLLRMFARFADEQCNSRDICRFNDISNSISLGDVVRRLDTGCPLDYWSSSRITTRILADRNQVRP